MMRRVCHGMSIQKNEKELDPLERKSLIRLVVWSLIVSGVSFVAAVLLACFGNNGFHCDLAIIVIILSFVGPGVALTAPFYAKGKTAIAVVLTMIYAVVAYFGVGVGFLIACWAIGSR